MAKIKELKVGIHLMKRNLLIITILLLVPILFSCTKEDIGYKSSKLHVAVAGTLSSLLTSNQRDTTTSLVLTGTIDARDFKYFRDSMPRLAELDLSAVTIAAYTGTGGPFGSTTITVYPANTLPEYAFCSHYPIVKTSLTSITLPNSVTSIGSNAFEGCSGLTTITLSNSITSIGSNAFYVCSGLTTITLPNSVTSIGTYAFADCNRLTTITLPNSLTSIGEAAFYVCSGLTTITLSNSITSIGSNAFGGCSGLTTITLPNSLTSIGEAAFEGCSGLTMLTLPNSITSIGKAAFLGCSGLTTITAKATTPVNLLGYVFMDVPTSTCVLYVPSGSVSAYQTANQWKDFVHIVGI